MIHVGYDYNCAENAIFIGLLHNCYLYGLW
jgi:hypothetical protein